MSLDLPCACCLLLCYATVSLFFFHRLCPCPDFPVYSRRRLLSQQRTYFVLRGSRNSSILLHCKYDVLFCIFAVFCGGCTLVLTSICMCWVIFHILLRIFDTLPSLAFHPLLVAALPRGFKVSHAGVCAFLGQQQKLHRNFHCT